MDRIPDPSEGNHAVLRATKGQIKVIVTDVAT
jgi:hypothetical protein